MYLGQYLLPSLQYHMPKIASEYEFVVICVSEIWLKEYNADAYDLNWYIAFKDPSKVERQHYQDLIIQHKANSNESRQVIKCKVVQLVMEKQMLISLIPFVNIGEP